MIEEDKHNGPAQDDSDGHDQINPFQHVQGQQIDSTG